MAANGHPSSSTVSKMSSGLDELLLASSKEQAMAATKRELLEREVMAYLMEQRRKEEEKQGKKIDKRAPTMSNEDEDGYEEVIFDPTRAAAESQPSSLSRTSPISPKACPSSSAVVATMYIASMTAMMRCSRSRTVTQIW